MKTYPTTDLNASDLKTLIGEPFSTDYTLQMQAAELADLAAEDFSGYENWSTELEQLQFEQEQDEAKQAPATDGPIYFSRECDHPECKTSRCEKGLRIGGFDL